MLDQLFETYRRASESWLQVQQDTFRAVMRQWLTVSPNAAGPTTEWSRTLQKRYLDLTVDALSRQRESLDGLYKSGIQLVEQASRLSESKSTDDYRKGMEDLWRQWFDSVKTQSESQFRDAQSWAGRSIEIVQNASPPHQNAEAQPAA